MHSWAVLVKAWSHWWLTHLHISPWLSCKLLWWGMRSAWTLSGVLFAKPHGPAFSFPVMRCLWNSSSFSSSSLVALGRCVTHKCLLRISLPDSSSTIWGNLVSWDLEGQMGGFLYDMKYPSGHIKVWGKGLDMSLPEEMLDLGPVSKNNQVVGLTTWVCSLQVISCQSQMNTNMVTSTSWQSPVLRDPSSVGNSKVDLLCKLLSGAFHSRNTRLTGRPQTIKKSKMNQKRPYFEGLPLQFCHELTGSTLPALEESSPARTQSHMSRKLA